MLTTLDYILVFSNAAGLGVGIYFSSYLKKKAEHLATREDFDQLRAQTAALTLTTKEIETRMSGELWDRQKRWELKRDSVFETSKAMVKVANALGSLNAVQTIEHNPTDQAWIDARTDKTKSFLAAIVELDMAGLMIATVCDESTIGTIDAFRDFSTGLANGIVESGGDVFVPSQTKLWQLIRNARRAFRIELGVDKKD